VRRDFVLIPRDQLISWLAGKEGGISWAKVTGEVLWGGGSVLEGKRGLNPLAKVLILPRGIISGQTHERGVGVRDP